MGSVLALSLRERGHGVTLVTPAGKPCEFGVFTGEVYQSNARLFEAGVEVVTNTMIVGAGPGSVTTESSLSGRRGEMACDGLVPVTRRIPTLDLYDELRALQQSGRCLRTCGRPMRCDGSATPRRPIPSRQRFTRAIVPGSNWGRLSTLPNALVGGISAFRPEAFTLNPS